MLATFNSRVWTLLIVVSQCLAAPTSLREDDRKPAAPAAGGDSQPPVRIKRADEMIFNAPSGDSSSRVKKSDDVADDVTGWSDGAKKPAVNDGEETSATTVDEETEPQTTVNDNTNDKDLHQQQDDTELATSSEDSDNPTAAADTAGTGDDDEHSSLMLAENMDAQQAEQKLRAKRDLDADDIRELFNSHNVPTNDYFVPADYTYTDDSLYDDDGQRLTSDDDQEYDDIYDDVDGRPKRDDDQLYSDDMESEAVRELLAERAAEEARQALLAYLTAGQPAYRPDEPQYLVDPTAEDLALEEDEYNELMNGDDDDVYEEEEPEMTEKRFYPYSYEPYGGRWGAMVPGAKRADRDPYDRLYRLAEVLSRPAQLGSDYEKK